MFLNSGAWAAGGRTHMEMGRIMLRDYIDAEAATMLPGIDTLIDTDDLRRAFYAGCYLPDWGFTGVPCHEEGEASHWMPFQDAYVEVLRERYPWPWDPAEAKRQIAFFLGYIVHCYTDVPWHFSTHEDYSMVKKTKQMDGGIDPDMPLDLHTYATIQLDVQMAGHAWWPIDLLLEVFKRRGLNVTRENLVLGTNALQSLFSLGTQYGALGNLPYRSQCPWAKAHYLDYYFGGVNHCAAYTSIAHKAFYARLRGWYCFQDLQRSPWPHPPSFDPYMGIEEVHIAQQHPDNNAGGEPYFELTGDGPEDARAGLIRIDTGSVPSQTKIKQARLWLYFAGRRGAAQTAPKTIEAFVVNRDWKAGIGMTDRVSGTSGRAAEEGEATWSAARQGQVPWKIPGCGSVPEDHAATPLASLTIQPSDPEGHWKCWDVTAAVQAWVAAPESNHGLLLHETPASAATPGVMQFYSSETFKADEGEFGGSRRVAWHPTLVVMPEP